MKHPGYGSSGSRGHKQIGQFARSESLKRRFARDIRDYYSRHIDEMLGRCLGRPRIKVAGG